jgi:hypothetical protein
LRLHESLGKWGGCLVGGAVSFVGLVVGFLLLIVVWLVTLSWAQQKLEDLRAKYQGAAYEEELRKQRPTVAAVVIIGHSLAFVAPLGLAILLWRSRVGKSQQELDRAIRRLIDTYPDEVEYFGGRSSLKNVASVKDLIHSLEAKGRV